MNLAAGRIERIGESADVYNSADSRLLGPSLKLSCVWENQVWNSWLDWMLSPACSTVFNRNKRRCSLWQFSAYSGNGINWTASPCLAPVLAWSTRSRKTSGGLRRTHRSMTALPPPLQRVGALRKSRPKNGEERLLLSSEGRISLYTSIFSAGFGVLSKTGQNLRVLPKSVAKFLLYRPVRNYFFARALTLAEPQSDSGKNCVSVSERIR